MSFPALKDKMDKLDAKRAELAKIFDEAGKDMDMSAVKSISGSSADKVDFIRKANEEIDDLSAEVAGLRDVEAIAAKVRKEHTPEGGGTGRDVPGAERGSDGRSRDVEGKTWGELFKGSDAYKGRVQGGVGAKATLDVELKTLMTTSAGWAPETTRTGMVVPYATRPVQVLDVIPQTTTSQAAVVYMEETTFTNNAAETAEGGTYPEAALALTERSSTVRKIAVWLPITDEQLEDEPQVAGYVNNRLPFMVRQRLDSQILTGDGTAPNLTGFLDDGYANTQTQAKGTDPVPDAVYKAMTKVRVTGRAVPNVVILHPNDWMDIRLLRTADGIYIWGSPSDAGPERIWGLPVVQTDAETEGTGLVLDTTFTELAIRRGIEMQVSNSHDTFFISGKQAIRADMRAALLVYRQTALCKVTGI